jgi:hypothetical protein
LPPPELLALATFRMRAALTGIHFAVSPTNLQVKPSTRAETEQQQQQQNLMSTSARSRSQQMDWVYCRK